MTELGSVPNLKPLGCLGLIVKGWSIYVAVPLIIGAIGLAAQGEKGAGIMIVLAIVFLALTVLLFKKFPTPKGKVRQWEKKQTSIMQWYQNAKPPIDAAIQSNQNEIQNLKKKFSQS
jgi:hypothetical protein